MVAEALGIHESTVSRSTASVLIQTPRGTFPLKMFFSSGLQASQNDEGVSARSIRRKIKDIIASEDPLKPISDAKISDLLKGDGFTVARRTVAKYRELENLKSTADRKRGKHLSQPDANGNCAIMRSVSQIREHLSFSLKMMRGHPQITSFHACKPVVFGACLWG